MALCSIGMGVLKSCKRSGEKGVMHICDSFTGVPQRLSKMRSLSPLTIGHLDDTWKTMPQFTILVSSHKIFINRMYHKSNSTSLYRFFMPCDGNDGIPLHTGC